MAEVKLKLLAIALISLIPLGPAAASADSPGPSFDCALARGTVETTICDDPNLSRADALMAQLFASVRVSAFGKGPSNEVGAQLKWLKDRQNCDKFGTAYASREECLRTYYRDRNQQLAAAALFREPALALETLYALDPEAAPLFEAIQLFVSEPPKTNWSLPRLSSKRARLLDRLEIYLAKFRSENDWSYGRDILEGEKIARAEDALSSDQKFAQFVQIASAYIGGDPVPRQLPCAAILKNRQLLEASGPVFGSTLDNFIIYPDCEETLPPLPALDRLVDNVWKLWPDCEGTIRFAGYRMFGLTVSGARVANGNDIRIFVKSRDARQGLALPQRKGLSPKLTQAAFKSLTGYYQRYQGVSNREAQLYAASMVREIGHGSDECS